MKEFLKYTFATITGLVITGVLLILFGVISLFGVVASSEVEVPVKKNSIMKLELNGVLVERSQESLESLLMQVGGENPNVYGLDDILASIEKAKLHPDIHGIYVQANMLQASYASLQAIRNALADFKTTGKFVVAYGDNYSQGLYYLASVADKVILNPQGHIEWHGIAATPIFYKDLLDKLGVEMQIFKVGTYKSAVEPFIATEMSDANREQVSAYVHSIWNQLLSDIAQSREVSEAQLDELADKMIMFYPSEESVKCGMADTLMYKSDMRAYLKNQLGLDEEDKLPVLGLTEMTTLQSNTPKDPSGNIVAVYYATGEITDIPTQGMFAADEIVGDKVVKDLVKLKDDNHVKAVVLRVNSPGGSAFASEQIWNAVRELKREKPVIVSMGDYAASGGYYISCVADSIVAEPTTLTGSIGIFGMIPNVEKLTDKLGIDVDVVKTNQYADMGNLLRPMNNSEKAMLQRMIVQGYDLFVKRCAEGRLMSDEAIRKIAEGRVWTGEMAKEIGLVDKLGGLDVAIDMAAAKAEIANYSLVAYPKKASVMDLVFSYPTDNYVSLKAKALQNFTWYKELKWIDGIQNRARIQARIPFAINLN